MRIAAIDDDDGQLDLIRCSLRTHGHECHGYQDGQSFLRDFRRDTFDLLIVDWQLPDTSGIDIIQAVRKSAMPQLPILLLTNRREERDVMEGFRAGADDFISKPARIGEFTARVQGLLRRAYTSGQPEQYAWGPYVFDPTRHVIDVAGRRLQLTQKEFNLALLLFRNLGRLLSRRYLLESIWTLNNPPDSNLMSRSLDTHISRIRSLLHLRADQGYRLSAIYGQGYRLEAIDSLAPAAQPGPAAASASENRLSP